MTLHETYYNRFNGWGETPPTDAIRMYIMRSNANVLSPSKGLLDWWNAVKGLNLDMWDEYVERFLEEMKSPQTIAAIKRLAELSKEKDVWLICSCSNKAKHCHRFLVYELIQDELNKEGDE